MQSGARTFPPQEGDDDPLQGGVIPGRATVRLIVSYHIHMDWRNRLRKLANHESHLSRWRLALIRIVDPIEWYIRREDNEKLRPPRRRRRRYAASWTEYVPSGRSPDLELHRRILEEASQRDSAREARGVLRREPDSFFEVKARELLGHGEVMIEGATGRIQARLVRFRNGAVFEHAAVSSQGTASGRTRIDRSQFADPVPMLAAHLESAALSLGADPGPLR